MKVYKVYWHDAIQGCQLRWEGSKRDAQRKLMEALKSYETPSDAEPSGVEMCDIPTDKYGLLGWLNLNFGSDNG